MEILRKIDIIKQQLLSSGYLYNFVIQFVKTKSKKKCKKMFLVLFPNVVKYLNPISLTLMMFLLQVQFKSVLKVLEDCILSTDLALYFKRRKETVEMVKRGINWKVGYPPSLPQYVLHFSHPLVCPTPFPSSVCSPLSPLVCSTPCPPQ